MAEGPREERKEVDGECSFSPTCGRNICIDGSTATWTNNDSGGRFFIDRSLSPDEEIILTFSGKGHTEVGIISIDPITITDVSHVENMKELTVIQTARIYKQEGTTKIKRSKEGDRIITEAEGGKSRSKVYKEQSAWITVNILFGDLNVKIGSQGYKFSPIKGENVSTKNELANLNFSYPCAVCFVMNPIKRGETVSFQASDVNTVGAPSKHCRLRSAISKSNPEEFMISTDKYYDITSLPVIHFDDVPMKCKNEIRIEHTTDGTITINHEKGKISKYVGTEKVYCVFELGRIQLRSARKEKQNIEDTVSPICAKIKHTAINQSDVPDSVYMKSKRELDEIRQDAEEIAIYSDDYDPAFESRNIEIETSDGESQVANHQKLTSKNENSKPLHERIRENFQMLVSMIEINPVLDYLYQAGNITMEDFHRFRQLAKSNMAEANRELLYIISRRQNFDTEFFEDILIESRQDGILAVMFPHQSYRKAMKSEYLNDSCVDYRPLCFSIPKPILPTFCVGAISGFQDNGASSVIVITGSVAVESTCSQFSCVSRSCASSLCKKRRKSYHQ